MLILYSHKKVVNMGWIDAFIRVKPFWYTSLGLFLFALLCAPFNVELSTILFLFNIALWSRLICMLTPYTKDFEVVDITSIVIALSLGIKPAVIFAVMAMLVSRFFGPMEWWLFTVKDSIALIVSVSLSPFLFSVWGGNFVYTLFTFTAIRYVAYLVSTVFLEPDLIMLEVYYTLASVPVAYIQNTVAGFMLGGYLLGLIGKDIAFHWELPVILLGVLVGSYVLKKSSEEGFGNILNVDNNVKEKRPFVDFYKAILDYLQQDQNQVISNAFPNAT